MGITFEQLQQLFDGWVQIQNTLNQGVTTQQTHDTRPEEPILMKNPENSLGHFVEQVACQKQDEVLKVESLEEDPKTDLNGEDSEISKQIRATIQQDKDCLTSRATSKTLTDHETSGNVDISLKQTVQHLVSNPFQKVYYDSWTSDTPYTKRMCLKIFKVKKWFHRTRFKREKKRDQSQILQLSSQAMSPKSLWGLRDDILNLVEIKLVQENQNVRDWKSKLKQRFEQHHYQVRKRRFKKKASTTLSEILPISGLNGNEEQCLTCVFKTERVWKPGEILLLQAPALGQAYRVWERGRLQVGKCLLGDIGWENGTLDHGICYMGSGFQSHYSLIPLGYDDGLMMESEQGLIYGDRVARGKKDEAKTLAEMKGGQVHTEKRLSRCSRCSGLCMCVTRSGLLRQLEDWLGTDSTLYNSRLAQKLEGLRRKGYVKMRKGHGQSTKVKGKCERNTLQVQHASVIKGYLLLNVKLGDDGVTPKKTALRVGKRMFDDTGWEPGTLIHANGTRREDSSGEDNQPARAYRSQVKLHGHKYSATKASSRCTVLLSAAKLDEKQTSCFSRIALMGCAWDPGGTSMVQQFQGLCIDGAESVESVEFPPEGIWSKRPHDPGQVEIVMELGGQDQFDFPSCDKGNRRKSETLVVILKAYPSGELKLTHFPVKNSRWLTLQWNLVELFCELFGNVIASIHLEDKVCFSGASKGIVRGLELRVQSKTSGSEVEVLMDMVAKNNHILEKLAVSLKLLVTAMFSIGIKGASTSPGITLQVNEMEILEDYLLFNLGTAVGDKGDSVKRTKKNYGLLSHHKHQIERQEIQCGRNPWKLQIKGQAMQTSRVFSRDYQEGYYDVFSFSRPPERFWNKVDSWSCFASDGAEDKSHGITEQAAFEKDNTPRNSRHTEQTRVAEWSMFFELAELVLSFGGQSNWCEDIERLTEKRTTFDFLPP